MIQKIHSQCLLTVVISIIFASCGGGSGSDSQMPDTTTEDINTEVPIVDQLPSEDIVNDNPADEVPPGEGMSDKHWLGPEYGEELSFYHALLVMKVLRLISTTNVHFAGVNIGPIRNLLYEYGDYLDELSGDQINGERLACIFSDEPHGTKTSIWNNGGSEYPSQYTSTRIYNNCRQHGKIHRLGDLEIYDGTLIQSGAFSEVNSYEVIQGGNIHADQLTLTNSFDNLSVSINGYIKFSYNQNGKFNTEIQEIGLTIHEDNDTWGGGGGRYIEDITVHGGNLTFGTMEYETQTGTGTGTIFGVKDATVRIDVENNNHKHLALLVTTVTPASNDVIYSLEINRAELSDQPQPTHHSIRIDRMQPEYGGEGYLVYNVYIDLNDNGVIDTENAYPKEFYEDVALQRERWTRWGYMNEL